jgi:hypothetical protein
MMSRNEILVLDDSRRFPLHVWRYLSGCLGFGIGEVGKDGMQAGQSNSTAPWILPNVPMVTEDDCHRLWWVPADGGWQGSVAAILSGFSLESPLYVLVDIYGEPGFSAKEVCDYLDKRWPHTRIRLVSAYYSGHHIDVGGTPLSVLPKSRETLRKLCEDLKIKLKTTFGSKKVKHILVTGAGFEIRDQRGGFGMPFTDQILREMEPPFVYGKEETSYPEPIVLGPASPQEDGETALSGAFPIPISGIWESTHRREVLNQFALEGNLDNYWDYLLEEELQKRVGSTTGQVTAKRRDQRKTAALWRERRLREAFRRSLLRYDWGFMNQSLDGARLPLHAWLTTNYTQFANRAISLYGDLSQDKLGIWRIIATAAEARILRRENPDWPSQQERYLFKLHGDIAHLQTMAIAGHDKDRFSPLSMPVEDLYEIYAAAEWFLPFSLRASPPSLVVWHIVGHGLQDRRLCELLAGAARQIEASQVFVLVDVKPEEPCRRLKTALANPDAKILACQLFSTQYMGRLLDLLRSEEKIKMLDDGPAAFVQWATEACGAVERVDAAASPSPPAPSPEPPSPSSRAPS